MSSSIANASAAWSSKWGIQEKEHLDFEEKLIV